MQNAYNFNPYNDYTTISTILLLMFNILIEQNIHRDVMYFFETYFKNQTPIKYLYNYIPKIPYSIFY